MHPDSARRFDGDGVTTFGYDLQGAGKTFGGSGGDDQIIGPELARLTPQQLDDIGVSQEQALEEAAKPWRMR